MAFGFPPKYSGQITDTKLPHEHQLAIALEVTKKLDWNVGTVTKNGLTAYTKFSASSWSEEVQIVIEGSIINIHSKCTGNQIVDWGKNRKNINAFINMFNTTKTDSDPTEIERKSTELETELVITKENQSDHSTISQKENKLGFLSFFVPTKDYLVTPILVYANIAIFIIMAINGVHVIEPDSESLLSWGANFRPLTLDGEWWRILSCCFLHIGILHLLMNMYALLYIGLLLEPYLGKSRFLGAYLLSAVAGSVASLFWNDITVSAGASGAIFGMYGVFLAMLTTNLIEKSARNTFLTSILVFVGYNLLNGIQGGIDNAAHIGGLIAGIIVGYCFYPGLRKPQVTKLKLGTIGLASIIILSCSFLIFTNTGQSDLGKYNDAMKEFGVLEEKALTIFNMPENNSDQDYLDEIKTSGIPNWKASFELLERVDQLDLPKQFHEQNLKLKEYCTLRIKSYQLIYKSIEEDSEAYQNKIDACNTKIDAIIKALSAQ